MDDRATVATELQFRTLLQSAEGVAVFVLDDEGRVVSWNAGAERMTGRSTDDVLEQSLATFYQPRKETETPTALCDAARQGGRTESVGWCRGADGESYPIELELRPVDEGTPGQFVVTLRDARGEGVARNKSDVTAAADLAVKADVRVDEAEQSESVTEGPNVIDVTDDGVEGEVDGSVGDGVDSGVEGENDSVISNGLFEVAEEALYRLDTDGRFVTISEGVASITGYSQEDLLGEHVSKLFDPETVERLHPLDESSTAGDVSETRTTTTLETADGEGVRCEIRSRVVGSDRRVRGSVGVIENVSDRVGEASSLEHQREVVQRLLDTAPVALAIRESQTGVTLGNARGRELFDLVGEDDSGATEPAVRFFDADGEPMAAAERPILRAERTLEPVYGEKLSVEQDGDRRRSFRVHAVPVTDEGGELTHVVAAAEDITEHREREQQLESLAEAAGRLLNADSPKEVATIAVDAAEDALNGLFVSVALYDEASGSLRPQIRPSSDAHLVDIERLLDPDVELAWRAYVDDERYVFRDVDPVDERTNPFDVVVYPLGRHGVFVFGETDAPETTSFARILAANTESALDRADRESQLVEQQTKLREQNQTLGRLNRVNGVTRQILRTLVDATSRTEIERSVCEQLTTTGPYRFAWIGGHDVVDNTVTPRISAGFENGYLSQLRELTDRSHPSVRAAEGTEPVVVDDLHDDPPFDPWRSEALKRGYQSLICLPLRYRGTSYGVLCVYADRSGVFDEMERSVLRELSNTTAYAINAAENKRSLVGDADVELELTVEDASVSYLRASEELGCTLELDDLVTVEEGGLRATFTARGAETASVVEFMKQTLDVRDIHVVDESKTNAVFKCTVCIDHIFQTFIDHGAVPQRFDAADGVGAVTVTVSDRFDVRSFVETLRARYDRVELTARRERARGSPTLGEVRAQLKQQLTERQQEALETAFLNGFFESPRTSTEREIADRLGIAQSTLNGHLRAAQRKILEYLYQSD
ncbi:PAS domain S-box protein [Haloprofundus salilacus]|uniref:PAS domain S-box protein n=1 Tax=Haloprofundus salilacus TaxID=2876190 RepID=UPI001CCC93C0|nr:PAS domain S-box protein [Haloprofundus salilacus]